MRHEERFVLSAHWRYLFSLLARRPFKALGIAWLWATRRRVRALGRLRMAGRDIPRLYPIWLSIHQPPRLSAAALATQQTAAKGLPPIAVHLHLRAGETVHAVLGSMLGQIHSRWQLHVTSADEVPPVLPTDPRIAPISGRFATRVSAMARVLDIAEAPYLVPLSANCTLAPGALLAFARAADADAVLYADQDELGPCGERCNPWLKPKWEADLFLAQDYLSAACALPVVAARAAGVDARWNDALAVPALLARLLLNPHAPPVRHVPYVAVTTPTGWWRAECPGRADVIAALTGLTARGGPFGTLAVCRPLPDPLPLVSVIVPTRDRVDLMRTCAAGVLHHTDYPAIELVIADNDSVDPEALAFFADCAQDPRVQVVRWPHPYNYSAINNFAVAHARGPYVCLLNNDTEVIDPAWLRQMMAHAVRPDTGAVGARLLYPDYSVQHAGVVIGMGNAAGHAHRGLAEGEPGWFAQALVAREATAVSAACLVVAKDRFEAVGGLDEESLAITYNDVDLCLKLRAAGWRNRYVPQAVLIHHESKSRGFDFAPEHLARYMRELSVFQERWGTVGYSDPTHHTALDPASEEYRLKL